MKPRNRPLENLKRLLPGRTTDFWVVMYILAAVALLVAFSIWLTMLDV